MQNPVLTVECNEPKGVVTRNVYPMALTIDNLKTFWEKASKFRTLFTEEVNGDFKKFLELFISQDGELYRVHGLFWVVDDFVGVYYMTNITDIDAKVHYTFLDRRHTGREVMTRMMLKYAFDKYKFRRLSTEVPLYVGEAVFGFVNALGFKKEGRKRKCVLYKNEWFDVALFGLLKEEAEQWELDTVKLGAGLQLA